MESESNGVGSKFYLFGSPVLVSKRDVAIRKNQWFKPIGNQSPLKQNRRKSRRVHQVVVLAVEYPKPQLSETGRKELRKNDLGIRPVSHWTN